VVYFGELVNGVCIGNPQQNDNPLAVVATGVFGSGLLVSEDTIAINAEHLVGEVVDGSCSASVGSCVGNEAGEFLSDALVDGDVQGWDRRMRITWWVTEEAMISN
jgi:hypothetical protein